MRDATLTSVKTYPYKEIVFSSRGDAGDILDTLVLIASKQDGFVGAYDFFDLCIVPRGEDKEEAKYGWTSDVLAKVPINRSRDGYYLDLPAPMKRVKKR